MNTFVLTGALQGGGTWVVRFVLRFVFRLVFRKDMRVDTGGGVDG